jgi:hypothetical protein
LVSDIPAGDGNVANLFYGVSAKEEGSPADNTNWAIHIAETSTLATISPPSPATQAKGRAGLLFATLYFLWPNSFINKLCLKEFNNTAEGSL